MVSRVNPNDIFTDKLSDISICHKVLFNYREILTGIELEKYYSYFDVLLLQYQMKSISLTNLLNGSKFEDENFIDIPSSFILLRGLIENYLMFNYLFIQPSSKEEIFFRSLIYQRSGLINRQDYNSIPKNNPVNELPRGKPRGIK